MYGVYNFDKRVELHYCTVEKLIEQLQKLPKDAEVRCCEDYQFYLHITEDKKVISIDNDPMDDEYD